MMDLSAPLSILNFRVNLPWIGKGKSLLVGDSITENLVVPHPGILNFGISGCRAHDMRVAASQIMTIAAPSKVAVMIGTNDIADSTLSFNDWVQDYFWLAVALENGGVAPVLMTILPTEVSLTSGPLAPHNNPAKLKQYNDYIKATAETLGLRVQDTSAALAGPDGYLPANSTFDGLHPLGALNTPLWAQFEQALA